jgi:hypothetical protein
MVIPGHDQRNDTCPDYGRALNENEKRAGARDSLRNRSSRAPQGNRNGEHSTGWSR